MSDPSNNPLFDLVTSSTNSALRNTHYLRIKSTSSSIDWERASRRLNLLSKDQLEDAYVAVSRHCGVEMSDSGKSEMELKKWFEEVLRLGRESFSADTQYNLYFESEPMEWYITPQERVSSPSSNKDWLYHEIAFILSITGLMQAARIGAEGTNIPEKLMNISHADDNIDPGVLIFFPARGSADAILPLQWNPDEALVRGVLSKYSFDDDDQS